MSLSQSLLEESESGVSRLEAGTDRSQASEEPLLRAWDPSTVMPSCDKRSSMGQHADGKASVRECSEDWQRSRTDWAQDLAHRSTEQQRHHQEQKQHQRTNEVPALSNSGISLPRIGLGMVLLQACFQMVLFEVFLMVPTLHEHTQVCMVSMLLLTIAIFWWLTRQTIVMPVQQARDAVMRPFQPPADRTLQETTEEARLPMNCMTEAVQLLAAGVRLDVMRETLKKFMPPVIMQEVIEGNIRGVDVQNRDVSVMFVDIRGFTKLAEVLDPDSLLLFLQRYLSVMSRVLHLFDGSVAEIHGDGILAFWNAERDVCDHATKAVASSVAMVQALALLNEEMSMRHLPGIEIGIGLHQGAVLTGVIGCDKKLKWGCLGDTVNLASRLEGLCKHYGTSIICSQSMRDSLSEGERFPMQRLDTVQVRGRDTVLDIYKVLGAQEVPMGAELPGSARSVQDLSRRAAEIGIQPQIFASGSSSTAWPMTWGVDAANGCHAHLYEQGLAAFQNQDFALAFAICSALVEERPSNHASRLLQDRSAAMMTRVAEGSFSEQERAEFTGAMRHT